MTVLALSTGRVALGVAASVALIAALVYIRTRPLKFEPFWRTLDLALYIEISSAVIVGVWAFFGSWFGLTIVVVPVAQAAIEELKGERRA
jgi:hypothetical protein